MCLFLNVPADNEGKMGKNKREGYQKFMFHKKAEYKLHKYDNELSLVFKVELLLTEEIEVK